MSQNIHFCSTCKLKNNCPLFFNITNVIRLMITDNSNCLICIYGLVIIGDAVYDGPSMIPSSFEVKESGKVFEFDAFIQRVRYKRVGFFFLMLFLSLFFFPLFLASQDLLCKENINISWVTSSQF